MIQPKQHHLAQLNIGRLVAQRDDPRVAGYTTMVDRIYGLGQRMPGFVWGMEDPDESEPSTGEVYFGNDPLYEANLTVWENVETLEHFVWNTLHKKFYDQRAKWFEVNKVVNFVMWWVPKGHEPSMTEAVERLEYLRINGETDHAFGWEHVKGEKSKTVVRRTVGMG